jgi:hypothetical protein
MACPSFYGLFIARNCRLCCQQKWHFNDNITAAKFEQKYGEQKSKTLFSDSKINQRDYNYINSSYTESSMIQAT